jgi:SAM-dependent methyltransferase
MQMLFLEHLNRIRSAEIEIVISKLPANGGRILEIGAGTGLQAAEISKRGYEIEAIDVPDSSYKLDRVFPVTDYDGVKIPYPDSFFDVVFSSNALEHVRELEKIQTEIKRVLKPDGYCLHALPTHTWRIWTSLAAIPRGFIEAGQIVLLSNPNSWIKALRRAGSFLKQRRHGERGNLITEIYYFHPRWWRQHFRGHGFVVDHDAPMLLFYTGFRVLGSALSIEKRRKLSRYLGSSCHIYQLRRGSK